MPAWVSDPLARGRGRILGCALLLFGLAAAPVRADIFDQLEGTYGAAFRADLSCTVAPHRVTFSPDHRRAHFVLSTETLDYRGQPRRRADYTVLGHDDSGITMALDDETRLTADGKPVVWILRPAAGLDGYCWGRTDWPRGQCQHLNLRCKDDLPLG